MLTYESEELESQVKNVSSVALKLWIQCLSSAYEPFVQTLGCLELLRSGQQRVDSFVLRHSFSSHKPCLLEKLTKPQNVPCFHYFLIFVTPLKWDAVKVQTRALPQKRCGGVQGLWLKGPALLCLFGLAPLLDSLPEEFTKAFLISPFIQGH